MNLKSKTKSIITMIYLNYLCEDAEKKKINLILKDNEKKYQEELKEKYNTDNLLKKHYKLPKTDENKVINSVSLKKYKEPIFKIIINMIKRIFHKGE